MRKPRILAAVVLLALWAQSAAAAALLQGDGAAAPTPPAKGGPSGWRLNLPQKSPLVLPAFGAGKELYPLRQAAVYGGLTVTWRSSSRLLRLEQAGGRSARLLLDDPWLYDGERRVALPQALTLVAGAPCVDEASLRLILGRLCEPVPIFETASPDELAAAKQALAPEIMAAVPTLQPTQEPELVPTNTVNVAAKPLHGAAVRTVYIDAGHGGEDPGAHGPRGLKEKDVCLDIAVRLAAQVRALGFNAKLTRHDDDYLSLRRRTEIANEGDADIFISIHNNAARNRASRGTQVFFYDSQTSDRAAADLVAREESDANQLDILFTDLAKSLVRDESIGLADRVQAQLYKALNLKHRGLSYAPFYVLARTKMPAILIEVAFITNPSEETLLAQASFRERVAASIARGVQAYSQDKSR